MVVLVHDKVHLPITETLTVGFRRAFMYAYAVAYVGSLSLLSFSGFSCVFHLVAAVACKLSRLILTYKLIDG